MPDPTCLFGECVEPSRLPLYVDPEQGAIPLCPRHYRSAVRARGRGDLTNWLDDHIRNRGLNPPAAPVLPMGDCCQFVRCTLPGATVATTPGSRATAPTTILCERHLRAAESACDRGELYPWLARNIAEIRQKFPAPPVPAPVQTVAALAHLAMVLVNRRRAGLDLTDPMFDMLERYALELGANPEVYLATDPPTPPHVPSSTVGDAL